MFELKSIVNINQSLALTPELQQALKILALGDQELEELTKEELANNTALEEREDASNELSFSYTRDSNSYSIDMPSSEELGAGPPNLWDDFREQLCESKFNLLEREIGERLIDDMDENGYFAGSIEEIALELCVPATWIESVRKRMLFWEPAGCLAKTLNECIQAQALSAEPKANEILLRVLSLNFLERAIHKPKEIAHQIGCTGSELNQSLSELSRFRRHPGTRWEDEITPIQSTTPQVEVQNVDGELRVTNLRSVSARLWIDRAGISNGAEVKKEISAFAKQNMQRALFFLNALKRREQTVVRVVESIAKHQKDWFLCKQPLSPLTMKQVASDLQIHESTVSRAVANKYLRCERGTFAIRSFFVSQLPSASEKSHSSDTIKEAILKLVSKENSRDPLSDERICQLMCENQLFVARRTIAKYRTQLKIPIRSHRKASHY